VVTVAAVTRTWFVVPTTNRLGRRGGATRAVGEPPSADHPAGLTPGDRNGPEGDGPVPGVLGHVVVVQGPVAPVLLEPGPPQPEAVGQTVELLVVVGQQVGPRGGDRSDPGRLAPVVDVDGHRRGRRRNR